MSVSHWRRIDGQTHSCDAVVVGAGISGLSAAHELRSRGMDVVVLERHTLGWGASSRNAGYLIRGMAESYALASRTLGRETARLVWSWSEENLRLLIERCAIDTLPSFERKPSMIVAMSEGEAAELRESVGPMREDGFEVELAEGGTDTLWQNVGPEVALVNPNDAAINPWEMIVRMREALERLTHGSAMLAENTEVTAIDAGSSCATVRTADSAFTCEHVLVCTNAWARALLPKLGLQVQPNRGQMLAMRAPGVRLDASYYLDRGSEYIRQTPDGTVIVGGKRLLREAEERTESDATTQAIQEALEDYAERVLGVRGEVLARWAGTMGFSPTGLPIVASATEIDPGGGRVWFCGGLTGHGMSLGARVARCAVEAMLGEKEPPAGLEPAT